MGRSRSVHLIERRSLAGTDTVLEVSDVGTGEPVLFIQTALTADELQPVAAHPALQAYRRIAYHRRGYAGSDPATTPGSIEREAMDGRALLDELQVPRAHVVGLSFSGAIALQLAADEPDRVHTLTLIEPPPIHVPSEAEFRAANDRLLQMRDDQGVDAALDGFLTLLEGDDWRRTFDQRLPGSVAQMSQDAHTFFDVDLPALLAWPFARDDAARIDRAIAYVGGTDSGPWFAEVRELIRSWFPAAEDFVIEGAGHSLAITHPGPCARAISAFVGRHPIA